MKFFAVAAVALLATSAQVRARPRHAAPHARRRTALHGRRTALHGRRTALHGAPARFASCTHATAKASDTFRARHTQARVLQARWL